MMKTGLFRVFRLWMILVAEQLLLFPLAILLYEFCEVDRYWIFVGAFLLLAGLAMLAREFLPKKARPWILILGMLTGAGLSLLFSTNLVFRILAPILLSAILWHGVHMVEMGHPGAFFTSFLLLGFLLYPLTGWVFNQSSRFVTLLPPLGITGPVGILLSLVLINRQQIRDAGTVLERKLHLPGTLMRRNSLYLTVFILLALTGASWGFFSRLAMGFFGLAGKLIRGIFALLAGLAPDEEPLPDEPIAPATEMDMGPPAEPTPRWVEILQTVFLILLGLAGLALLLWGVYKLARRLLPFLKRAYVFLADWLRQFFLGDRQRAQEDPGFVDEVESLLNKNETALSAARRWLVERMGREPGFSSMKTDRERIRWLYRNTVKREIRRGHAYNPADTPTETLQAIRAGKGKHPHLDPEAAALLYGLVRYTDVEPEPEWVRDMRRACD